MLLLVMGAIFLLSRMAQSLAGVVVFNSEQVEHSQAAISWAEYLVSADFWNRTLQNWQSEFLAVGSMIALSIFLRQRGSSESKPVGPAQGVTETWARDSEGASRSLGALLSPARAEILLSSRGRRGVPAARGPAYSRIVGLGRLARRNATSARISRGFARRRLMGSGDARRRPGGLRRVAHAAVALVAGTLALAACTGAPTADESSLPQGGEIVELDPDEFSADIDHPYWPMSPGTQWEYREVGADGEELSVVVTATTDTREIANGITARVVRDTVYRGHEIVEDTFDWYAQRDDGSVWYLGEATAEFEDGEIVTTEGSFEAGVDGAQAGVLLPADPKPGQSYRQEYLQGEAEDVGEVLRVGERAEAPYGAFDDVLVTSDTNALEPEVVEYKFYARDLGPLLALDVAGGSGREELIEVRTVPDGTGTGPLGEPG